MENARLTLIHALSPLHPGTGQGVGVIDLPIAREKATGFPFLPGSSLKGPLRDACPAESRTRIFGPETANAADYAGSVQIADQRLLLLPVRSLAGTFAWVTSPFILARFRRDLLDTPGAATTAPRAIPALSDPGGCLVAGVDAVITLPSGGNREVVLEDLDLAATADEHVAAWATWIGTRLFTAEDDHDWRAALTGRICVVHDDVLGFLLTTATEITARVRLSDDKTVETGALWYEEALPAETVLAGLVVATPIKASVDEVFRVIGALTGHTLQLGGKATVGRGICRIQLV
jgi:CRISPR-associated protein Cmr4